MQLFKRRSRMGNDDILISCLAYGLSFLIILSVIYPLVYVISASISDPMRVENGDLILWPVGFTLEGYQEILRYEQIWVGYRNTILYTVCGTSLNLLVTLPCAYALSRKELFGRNAIMMLFTFTMFFSGGMIPTYLAMKNYHMLNTPLAILFPGMLSVYNMIIARTYFSTAIPLEIQEAAMIDGCRNTKMFLYIVLPLAAPMTAVIMLYYAVGHWNSYFNGLLYLTDSDLYPLQLVMRNILLEDMTQELMNVTDSESAAEILRRMQLQGIMKYGLAVVSSIPVLILYPFLQKYFEKGIMIGAVKGLSLIHI